jgi:hypothetical protein
MQRVAEQRSRYYTPTGQVSVESVDNIDFADFREAIEGEAFLFYRSRIVTMRMFSHEMSKNPDSLFVPISRLPIPFFPSEHYVETRRTVIEALIFMSKAASGEAFENEDDDLLSEKNYLMNEDLLFTGITMDCIRYLPESVTVGRLPQDFVESTAAEAISDVLPSSISEDDLVACAEQLRRQARIVDTAIDIGKLDALQVVGHRPSFIFEREIVRMSGRDINKRDDAIPARNEPATGFPNDFGRKEVTADFPDSLLDVAAIDRDGNAMSVRDIMRRGVDNDTSDRPGRRNDFDLTDQLDNNNWMGHPTPGGSPPMARQPTAQPPVEARPVTGRPLPPSGPAHPFPTPTQSPPASIPKPPAPQIPPQMTQHPTPEPVSDDLDDDDQVGPAWDEMDPEEPSFDDLDPTPRSHDRDGDGPIGIIEDSSTEPGQWDHSEPEPQPDDQATADLDAALDVNYPTTPRIGDIIKKPEVVTKSTATPPPAPTPPAAAAPIYRDALTPQQRAALIDQAHPDTIDDGLDAEMDDSGPEILMRSAMIDRIGASLGTPPEVARKLEIGLGQPIYPEEPIEPSSRTKEMEDDLATSEKAIADLLKLIRSGR